LQVSLEMDLKSSIRKAREVRRSIVVVLVVVVVVHSDQVKEL
jgi:hypothetical protein